MSLEEKNILEFKDLSFSWPGGLKLENVNLQIKKGDFVLITGPSGSGKSTLLRLASRLEEPETGAVYFGGKPVTEIDPSLLRQKVAMIQQTPTVIEGSVRDNLLFPFSFAVNKKLTVPQDEELKNDLKKLYLDISLEKEASALSVGQKQRVCILRTLLLKPEALLMDEPTSALDPESRKIVEKISENLNSAGTTILMVSHSDYEPAVPYRTVRVSDGKVREVGI